MRNVCHVLILRVFCLQAAELRDESLQSGAHRHGEGAAAAEEGQQR